MKYRLLALPLMLAGAAQAQDLTAFTLTVVNRGAEPIACASTIAHWFSMAFDPIPAGGDGALAFWSDPVAGTVYLLNESGEPMAVEGVWCGLAGRAWETRADIALARRAGEIAANRTLDCAPGEERLVCAVQ